MATNSTEGGLHPEDLLSMYALAALPEEAAREVEAHLDGCPSCRTDLASLEATAAGLAAAAVVRTPPGGLRGRLLEQVSRGQDMAPTVAQARSSRFRLLPDSWLRPVRLLAPLAATLGILLMVSLAGNVYLGSMIDRLNQDKANLTARIFHMSHDDTTLAGFLEQADVARYLIDNPSNEPLMLMPPGGEGDHQGVLLFAEDSRRAVLLVANMTQPNGSSGYQVWLWRPQERVRMGELDIDSNGMGSMALYHPHESVLRFEKVFLSRSAPDPDTTTPGDMVLEGAISAFNRPR